MKALSVLRRLKETTTLRLLHDTNYRRSWIKFRFQPFWYGILGMP